jgi:hypothetical protein
VCLPDRSSPEGIHRPKNRGGNQTHIYQYMPLQRPGHMNAFCIQPHTKLANAALWSAIVRRPVPFAKKNPPPLASNSSVGPWLTTPYLRFLLGIQLPVVLPRQVLMHHLFATTTKGNQVLLPIQSGIFIVKSQNCVSAITQKATTSMLPRHKLKWRCIMPIILFQVRN